MVSSPDIPTLRLCSLLESAAYAAIFITFWARRRDQTYLLHWGLSSVLYAMALFGFEYKPGPPTPLSSGMDYGLVALADFLLVSGMRIFDGKPAFRQWMAAPILATALAAALPLAFVPGHAGLVVSHVLGSVGLGACMVISAIAILRGAEDLAVPRRIVAIAMLAYGPGYIVSICVELWGSFGSTTLDLLPMLQDQVLLGVLNLGLLATPWERALRELKESVLRDALTGAWNRTALKQQETELALPTTSLFLIDIDHFKTINDTHGHAAGDAVLIALSGHAQALLAERGGMFVRLGGDEFVMAAPTADDSDARTLAERIRAIPDPVAAGLPVFSLSIGLSRVHADEKKLSQAMARADLSLYRAKASGRNQIAAA
ncbi:MAG: GGDEF domain-containing protein [Sphingomonas sp.]|nr:GGDEF domain-containing protein [Sphingomonas sp.]